MKKLIIPLLLLSLNSYSQRFKTGYEQKPYGIYAGGEVGFGNLRQVVVASATVGYHTDNNFLFEVSPAYSGGWLLPATVGFQLGNLQVQTGWKIFKTRYYVGNNKCVTATYYPAQVDGKHFAGHFYITFGMIKFY